MLAKIFSAAKIYLDRRMLVMVAFGFSSGFPFPLVFNTLSLWLGEAGLPLAVIGTFSLLKTPYSFKWAWSPLIDRLPIPGLSFMGRRRSWSLLTMLLVGMSIFAMSLTNPAENPSLMAALTLILCISSASQDIVLDAYRVENFKTSEQAAASATFILGYRLGFIFSGAGALYLADVMSWNHVYAVMSGGILIGLAAVLSIREPKAEMPEHLSGKNLSSAARFRQFFQSAVICPFKDFMTRPGWAWILLFILLYRLSDAYISPMAYLFYKDMGFGYSQIATITKIYGTVATIAGMLVGGMLLNKMSLTRGLLFCGILQGLSNLIYVAQTYAGNNLYMLTLTISVENITGGMGTAAFVAYISSLCNRQYTATQYALLSSLMSLARDVLASSSGWLVQHIGWSPFFITTTIMAIPGLLVLIYLARRFPPAITSSQPETNSSAAEPRR